ncbi:cell surface protein [Campylobacter fetus]|uniref:cell surface protein n=1 Tax=Campylobacter fetus TaxID=196 RepID=UPI00138DF724|nr:cell surface protein [Campylobacter fetus]
MKYYRNFLLKLAAFIIGVCVLYVLFFIVLGKIGSLDSRSVKNFLLTNTVNENRIIVESGSNSFHGINAKMIEDHFGKLTLNLGDYAGYPLKIRLYRTYKFAHKGDVVIYPLEYRYYMNDVAPTVFYKHLLSEIYFYFDNLPFNEKLKVILQTPASYVFITGVKKAASNLKKLFRDKLPKEFDLKATLKEHRGDYLYQGPLPQKDDMKVPCDEYIFAKEITGGRAAISEAFKENIKLMKKIEKEKGVKFIFTYPTVIGESCYDFSGEKGAEFKKFLVELKNYVTSNGFDFIGDFNDSYLPDRKYMLDTWFHANPDGRDVRTKKLIENLDKSNLKNDLYANGLQNSSISN